MSRPRAVVLPHPPLLVPELTGPGAVAAEELRSACGAAVRSMIASEPPLVLLMGSGQVTRRHPGQAWGTLAGYGVPIEAPQEHTHVCGPGLPLSLTVGRWVLESSGYRGPLLMQEISVDEPTDRCARLGADLAAELADRSPGGVWLVLGDLSTKRTERAPGSFDPRAAAFDQQVELALSRGDPQAVLDLDCGLAVELGAAGRSVLQVLAAGWSAAAGAGAAGRAQAMIDYAGAPYGVGYVVARWN